MALILNSGLPPGTSGLWWFPQDLGNLGSAATGAASLSGSTLTGGVVVHDATTDRTQLAANSDLLIPVGSTVALTIMFAYRKRDTTPRASVAFGVVGSTGGTNCHLTLPHSDSVTYWDVGGTYQQAAGYGATTAWAVWAVTTGARGMEIWKNGLRDHHAASTVNTRTTAASLSFELGRGSGLGSDLAEYQWVFLHATQLSESLIAAISADPGGQLTQEAGGGGGGLAGTVFASAVVQ